MVVLYFTGLGVLFVAGLAGVPYMWREFGVVLLLCTLGAIAAWRHRNGQPVFPWSEN